MIPITDEGLTGHCAVSRGQMHVSKRGFLEVLGEKVYILDWLWDHVGLSGLGLRRQTVVVMGASVRDSQS